MLTSKTKVPWPEGVAHQRCQPRNTARGPARVGIAVEEGGMSEAATSTNQPSRYGTHHTDDAQHHGEGHRHVEDPAIRSSEREDPREELPVEGFALHGCLASSFFGGAAVAAVAHASKRDPPRRME